MTGARVAAIIGLAVAIGCGGCGGGGGDRGTLPDGPDGAPRGADTPTASAAVEASGEGATADAAYEDAIAALATALYGAEAWAQVLPAPLHDRARDPMRQQESGGVVRVWVGLTRERVAALLAAEDDAALATEAADAWGAGVPTLIAETLSPAAKAYVMHMRCARRRALLSADCTPPALDEADGLLRSLANRLRLRPHYVGGVPLGADRHPLRPLTAIVEIQRAGVWTPLAGVPVRVASDDATDDAGDAGDGGDSATDDADDADPLVARSTVTDADGLARLAFQPDAAWPGDTRMRVDAAAMLGPLAIAWPEIGADMRGRVVGVRRWAAVIVEQSRGQRAADAVFTDAFTQFTTRAGATRFPLSAEDADALREASATDLGELLPERADTWAGAVDAVLFIEVDSAYASRMGAHRVRYEATGAIRVFDAWTGIERPRVEDSAAASGVGDERADRAAREALGERLGARFLAAVL